MLGAARGDVRLLPGEPPTRWRVVVDRSGPDSVARERETVPPAACSRSGWRSGDGRPGWSGSGAMRIAPPRLWVSADGRPAVPAPGSGDPAGDHHGLRGGLPGHGARRDRSTGGPGRPARGPGHRPGRRHRLDIRAEAGRHGLSGKAVRATVDSIGTLPMPLIAHWENNHFIVVERVSVRWIWIADPAVGRRRWTGPNSPPASPESPWSSGRPPVPRHAGCTRQGAVGLAEHLVAGDHVQPTGGAVPAAGLGGAAGGRSARSIGDRANRHRPDVHRPVCRPVRRLGRLAGGRGRVHGGRRRGLAGPRPARRPTAAARRIPAAPRSGRSAAGRAAAVLRASGHRRGGVTAHRHRRDPGRVRHPADRRRARRVDRPGLSRGAGHPGSPAGRGHPRAGRG